MLLENKPSILGTIHFFLPYRIRFDSDPLNILFDENGLEILPRVSRLKLDFATRYSSIGDKSERSKAKTKVMNHFL